MGGASARRANTSRPRLRALPHTPNAAAKRSASAQGGRCGSSGNSSGVIIWRVTHLADPAQRFAATRASMTGGKDMLRGLNAKEVMLFTQVTAAPALLVSMLGLGDRFPPFSTVISNVPGPKRRSYWNGVNGAQDPRKVGEIRRSSPIPFTR